MGVGGGRSKSGKEVNRGRVRRRNESEGERAWRRRCWRDTLAKYGYGARGEGEEVVTEVLIWAESGREGERGGMCNGGVERFGKGEENVGLKRKGRGVECVTEA